MSRTVEGTSLRKLGRVDHWWYSKVAPAIAVSYCAALVFKVPVWETARSILLIAFVGLCAGSYGHMVNDACDVEVDRKAGKANHMAAFRPWKRFLLCLAALMGGFAPAAFVSYSRTSLLLLAVEFLLPTIYSVPPIRLKGRGAFGLVCDALGAHLIPCLYVISVLAHFARDPELARSHLAWEFSGGIAVWALCLGLVGIVSHEFEDRENDIVSGIETFATGMTFDRVRTPMTVVYGMELMAFAGLAALFVRIAPLLAVFAVLYTLAVGAKLLGDWHYYRNFTKDEITRQWWHLSHPFYEGYFPLAVAIQCAWNEPWLALLPAMQLGAFAVTFKRQLPELRAVPAKWKAFYNPWVLARFLDSRMNVSSPAEVGVMPVFSANRGIRFRIRESGTEPWHIHIARDGCRVAAGRRYVLRIELRADRQREITLGVRQDYDPWWEVGCHEVVSIDTEKRSFAFPFVARCDDERVCCTLWLGGCAGQVEARNFALEAVEANGSIGSES